MYWAKAIERNHEALKGIVEALFAMLEAAGFATAERVPRPLRLAVLQVLRPAESAVRRLIVIAARGLVLAPSPARPFPRGLARPSKGGRLSFPLFDTRKRFEPRRRKPRFEPRIWVLDDDPIVPFFRRSPAPLAAPAKPAPPPGDGLVDARRLSSRLVVLKAALDDLPGQARRLVRLLARRERADRWPKSPLRPGRPPGSRKRHVHPIDQILIDCHGVAFDALKPDTS